MTRSVLNTLSFADNSVTTAKVADNAITTNKRYGMPETLKPVWMNFQYNAGGNSSHRFVYNYGKKIYCNNGNNGPAVRAMLEGSTGTGNFMIEFIPGYYWGWSGMYLTEVGGYATDANGDITTGWYSGSPAGYTQWWFANNSSNNIRYATKWNGSSSSGNMISSPSGGTNGATWYVWRDSGVLSLSDSVTTTQLVASGDTKDYLVSAATGQGVSSVEIVSARRQL